MSQSETPTHPTHEEIRVSDYSRNAPCPCGSGKKFKRCYLPWRQEQEDARRKAAEERAKEEAEQREFDEAAGIRRRTSYRDLELMALSVGVLLPMRTMHQRPRYPR